MSLERANEMVKFLNNLNEERTRAGEAAGFKSLEVYKHGMSYGLTCHEVAVTFLGKNRAISWGRYLPEELSEEQIQSTAKRKSSKKTRKRKVNNRRSITMESVAAAVEASKNFTPKAYKADRLAMIKEIVKRKEAEDAAEAAIEELSVEKSKSSDKRNSSEESCYKHSPMEYTQEDVEEELALMDTYL